MREVVKKKENPRDSGEMIKIEKVGNSIKSSTMTKVCAESRCFFLFFF